MDRAKKLKKKGNRKSMLFMKRFRVFTMFNKVSKVHNLTHMQKKKYVEKIVDKIKQQN